MKSETLWLQVPAAKKNDKKSLLCREGIHQLIAYSLSSSDSLRVKYNNFYRMLSVKNESLSDKNNNQIQTMDEASLNKNINIGRQLAQRAKLKKVDLIIIEETNNLNIMIAATVICAVCNITVVALIKTIPFGRLKNSIKEKQLHIQKCLNIQKQNLNSTLDALCCLGSSDIAVLTGSYLCCAHMGLPILIKGYSGVTAAIITTQLCPGAEEWFLFSKQIYKKTFQNILVNIEPTKKSSSTLCYHS